MVPTQVVSAADLDRVWMRRCLELAETALGQTAPNPLVGCVVVKDGEVVGEGFHPKAGQPHAEVYALKAAAGRAQGATLYVNLEPCNHYGRTPPCTEAVIAAGVRRVVIGMVDPNPQVAGQGVARLRAAGLEVTVGVEAAACEQLNEAFSFWMLRQRPFGILKYAMTLDGKIAATGGHSAWVTSVAARSQVHTWRKGCDAVVVGGETVRQDDPLLTSRQAVTPLRVVMSRSLALPKQAQLWNTQIAPTLVCTEPVANPAMQAFLRDRGVEVQSFSPLTPQAVMAFLGQRDCLSVLWECGGRLAAAAIADGSIQKVLALIAPKIIGGHDAPSPIGDLGFTRMTDALILERIRWQEIGGDLLIEGYLPDLPQLPQEPGYTSAAG